MPLIHGKSKKAFEKNLKTEMHEGKPQAQSLAIAYSLKRRAQHNKKAHGGDAAMEECEHGGPEHCSEGCYAEGGSVDSWTKRSDNERGINRVSNAAKGQSEAGVALHPAFSLSDDMDVHAAKRKHKKTLDEMRSMPKPKLMAEGGETEDGTLGGKIGYPKGPSKQMAEGGDMKSKRERAMEAFHAMAEGGSVYSGKNRADFEKGVNPHDFGVTGHSRTDTSSYAGNLVGWANRDNDKGELEKAKGEHRRVLSELKSMPKPKLMAQGGFIGSHQHEHDEVDGDLMPEAHKHLELENEHVSHPDSHDSHVAHEELNQMGEEDEGEGDMDAIHPMVMRIMMGRAKGYSEGGKVANEQSGESTDEPTMAKWEDNEFDELAKSGGMDGHYSGSMEHGDDQEDHDREDIVSRIMKSRSKKDRMAVAGEGSSYGRRK